MKVMLSSQPHFDETWYRSTYPEAARAIATNTFPSGYHHYVNEGARRGHAPNCYFMPKWYLAWYRDARASVERGEYADAYEHYLREGIRFRLSPNPFFDERWYRQNYPDVDAGVREGRLDSGHQHFIQMGAEEGRRGSTIFDPAWYLAQYPEVCKDIQSGRARNSYDHFCRYGLAAAKSPGPDFDERWYRKQYPAVRHAIALGRWVSGLDHFVSEGMLQGYLPLPTAVPTDPLGYNSAASPIARQELSEFLSSRRNLDLRCSSSPVVSIVVVLHNRAALTLRCLRSIAASVDVPYEVILVDNASRDETAEVLAMVCGVRLQRNNDNLHFLRACNQGAAAAVGKYLLFLNNDCELRERAVSSAVAILDTEPAVGAVGGKLLLRDGRLQEAGCYLRPNAFSAGLGREQDPSRSEFMHRRDVPYCSGAFLLTPRALFHGMGGFDEVFAPAYCEDSDYCLRLWSKGRRVVFNPASIVEHGEAVALYRRFLYPSVLRNMATLHYRYPDYFASVPDYGIAPVSSFDGKNWRRACLWIVDEISERPAWAGTMRRMVEDGRFVTIYPLCPWHGNREKLQSWLPPEVELVTGSGREQLEAFCLQRVSVYDDALVLSPAPSLNQWLPNTRLLEGAMAHESQI